MSRLTKKINGVYYRKEAITIMFDSELDYNAIQKLGKLEDLEEELGCPLEVVIKATTEGIVDFEGKEHTVVFGESFLYVIENDKLVYGISLKNYQKNWWLKGEKDENG